MTDMTDLDEAVELIEADWLYEDVMRQPDTEADDGAPTSPVAVVMHGGGRSMIVQTFLTVDQPPTVVVSTFDEAGSRLDPLVFELPGSVQVT